MATSGDSGVDWQVGRRGEQRCVSGWVGGWVSWVEGGG